MSLLVDSCVWSLSFRRRPGASLNSDERRMVIELEQAIAEGRVAMLGSIRQEILSGIRDKTQFFRTQLALAPFLDEEMVPSDYVEAARLYNRCLDRGVQCGSTDILIAAVAVRKSFTVFTFDKALIRCLEVLGVSHS